VDDDPLFQDQDLIGELLHELDLVQVEQKRDAVPPDEVPHRLDDLGRPEEIQVRDELVGEDHLGPLEEGTCDGHPLPLPPAQAEHLLVRLVGDAQELEVLHRPLDLRPREETQRGEDALVPTQGPKEDVLQSCEAADQPELLGDVADPLAELRWDPPMVKPVAQDLHIASMGREEPG